MKTRLLIALLTVGMTMAFVPAAVAAAPDGFKSFDKLEERCLTTGGEIRGVPDTIPEIARLTCAWTFAVYETESGPSRVVKQCSQWAYQWSLGINDNTGKVELRCELVDPATIP